MLDKLKSLFAGGKPQEKEEADAPLAFAALLVEAARADELYEAREIRIIDRALMDQFGVDADAAAALRARGEEAQSAANDIQQFTRVVKTLPQDEKAAFVERLWRIVLSDGERDAFEDALIRRVCGLIYVSDPESGAARQRAEAAIAG